MSPNQRGRGRSTAFGATGRRMRRSRLDVGRALRSALRPIVRLHQSESIRATEVSKLEASSSNGSASRYKLEYQNDHGGEEEQMDEPGGHVERSESQCPQHNEQRGECPEHDCILLGGDFQAPSLHGR